MLPTKARAVVVGGGIIGNSVAYHLARSAGWNGSDVVLVEQNSVTSGTTWHAAGLCVTFGSMSETSTRLRQYSRELYSNILEKETGQATGFKPVGFIELATSKDRLTEFRRVAAFNRLMGVDVEEIGPDDVKKLFPLCETKDILAGFYVRDDGRVNPVDVTMALSKGCKIKGVSIVEGERAVGITRDNGKVTGVKFASGAVIEAEHVINCAGMWARQFGEACGVNVPNQAAEHYYLVTDKIPEVDPNWPVIEDPSSYTYIRPEAGGLMVGLFETEAAAWNVGRIPDDFKFGEIEPDWVRMGPFLDKAMRRVPRSLDVGMKKFFCGPESFTPDLSPIVGEAPELRNYWVAAGLNSIGILTGGGIGKLLANWITTGRSDNYDITGMNIDRLQKYQCNPEYRAERVVEALGMVYKPHYPAYSMKTARNVKKSPIHDRLKAQNAYFKNVSGFEGADWYAPAGVEPKIDKLTWGRHNFFPFWEREHRACREGVILMDMSFMAKWIVQGADAGAVLNRLCTANVASELGMISYTQCLNEAGKLEADITVAKLEEDRFLVIATDTAYRHVESWMKRHIPARAHCHVSDVTGAMCQINIQGPKSREFMARLIGEDPSQIAADKGAMSTANFPYRAAREFAIGFARVLVIRITYLGELGYELHIPSEYAMHVYDRILEVNEKHNLGLVHAGLKALSSLRMEKGYRDYGHDMDNTDNLFEVGLSFTADFDKPGGFIGKEALVKLKESKGKTLLSQGLNQRLVQVLLPVASPVTDETPFMFHNEVILRNGVARGYVRAASFGHTLGGPVGLAMIEKEKDVAFDNKFLETGDWEVQIGNDRHKIKASLRPMYDPNNDRIKI